MLKPDSKLVEEFNARGFPCKLTDDWLLCPDKVGVEGLVGFSQKDGLHYVLLAQIVKGSWYASAYVCTQKFKTSPENFN